MAAEGDRSEAGAGQVTRLKAAVGAEDEVANFDEGTAVSGAGGKQGEQGGKRSRSPQRRRHVEARVAGKKSPLRKLAVP